MRKIAFLILCIILVAGCFFAGSVVAQTTLTGIVVSAEDGKPLQGATVTVKRNLNNHRNYEIDLSSEIMTQNQGY
ncbi:hypothetical protein [Sediminibacterium sp.]|jgi:hypothetical protein|uniref:hypothetical protein n=1 Tax=Sediminibacterium sp. TaxID=1917865 RepID=UPI0025FB354D|nr:hypothetical protein [Sediminibacterium sp.]MBW0178501.1 hypothetical protein [Sediminibacterium sp.]